MHRLLLAADGRGAGEQARLTLAVRLLNGFEYRLVVQLVYQLCMDNFGEPSCQTTSRGIRSPKSVLMASTP